jgi:hypothetical protein
LIRKEMDVRIHGQIGRFAMVKLSVEEVYIEGFFPRRKDSPVRAASQQGGSVKAISAEIGHIGIPTVRV